MVDDAVLTGADFAEEPEGGAEVLRGSQVADAARVAVVVARFNEWVTRSLLAGAMDAWRSVGGADERVTVVWVPGAVELTATAKKLADGGWDAVLCLGCVIRGETDHYDAVVNQCAQGIKEVSVQTGVPCVFGVLTCDTLEQAIHRAGAKLGNSGRSAMLTAVEMANLMGDIEEKAGELESSRAGNGEGG
ncbi:MAG: 6,7-dimethyl-8-ribityllumazine synthase [Planctomycetota bacterium]